MKRKGFMNKQLYKSMGLWAFAMLIGCAASAQQLLKGKVISPYDDEPISQAYITVAGSEATGQTNDQGEFELNIEELQGTFTVWAPEFEEQEVEILGRDYIQVILYPKRSAAYDLPQKGFSAAGFSADYLAVEQFKPNAIYVEDVLQGAFPGLNLITKSGMPGEGAYFNLRGIRSLSAKNRPLILINGIPYLPEDQNSPIIQGYSESVFNAISINDIDEIRLLKGSEASRFGSLGSNGVLLIQTSRPEDMETIIEFSGQYGMAFNNKELPVLGVDDYKSYLGDVGLTRYEDMGDMLSLFPFLRDDPDYYYNFLYNNQTDWQDLINQSAFVTSNHLRVKGGDAIAKYDLAVGASNQGGTMDNTNYTRYTTRLNAQIELSQKFQLVTSMGLTYGNSKVHEQILSDASNPLVAALYKAPILSPFKKDEYNNQLPAYDAVRQFGVSNPLAVVNDTKMESDNFDVFVNTGINYQANENAVLSATFGYYSGYKRQSTFIPGRSNQTIVPLEDGVALNTARAGTGKTSNLFYNTSADFTNLLPSQKLNGGIGFQGLITKNEFDGGFGRNTSSDFYKTLSYVEVDGRYFDGYYDSWNWMSVYAYANYQISSQVLSTLNISTDGASSTGVDAPRWGIYPGAELTWQLKNSSWLKDQRAIDLLDIHAGFGLTGNSQFGTGLSKQYYSSQAYKELAGIVTGNVANTSLGREKVMNFDLGANFSFLDRKLIGAINYYYSQTNDLIFPQQTSSAYGIDYRYINGGMITNQGIEASIQVALVQQKNWSWNIGGMITTNNNVLKELDSPSQAMIREMSGDWALISQEGQNPYSFYGYQSEGVIATQQQADALALVDYKGDPFAAGDIHFTDQNQDGIINEEDRTLIGDASPDYFGSFFTQLRFRKFSLSAQFTYSKGNQIYNALRRELESLKDFRNQSLAVDQRWQTDGQLTQVPKATYGDPMNNSRFSDRWIEDGSYLRLSSLSLSYQLGRMNFIEGGEIYIAGENLLTLSNYLGLDPVMSYSYQPYMQGVDMGTLPLPTSIKFGFNLQF